MSCCQECRCYKRVLERDQCFLCLGQGHISRNYQKSKRCFYCKGSHNSAICENEITKDNVTENSEINSSANCLANSSCLFWQTTKIILVNLVNKREIKVKTLFDQESRRSYVTESVKLILTSHKNMLISTFWNKTLETKELQRVCSNLKHVFGNYFAIETFCPWFFCLPLKNQPVQFTQKIRPTVFCKIFHMQNILVKYFAICSMIM